MSFLCPKAGDNLADGNIKIKIEVDGKEINITADSLDNLSSSAKGTEQGLKGAEGSVKGVSEESKKSSKNIKDMAVSLGLVKVASAAFNVLKSSLDAAISRFDTLNKFPKVLQSLGVSAEDSERSINRLSDGIDGLPTKLNDIAANAQRMYTSFNDMDKATDSAIALNNAMLGSGSSANDAQRGTEQYLQVLQRGKMEMQEWKILQETMDVGLIKIAESFGFTGKSAKNDLYDALQSGMVTMDDFNDKLIEVGTGTGELAELARVNSLGLATSIENLKNAAARGITTMIDSFNKLSKETTGKEIAEHIDSLKVVINSAFKVIGNVIEGATPVVKGFTSTVRGVKPVVETLTPAIAGLLTAYAAYTIITKASDAIKASNAILKVAQASKTGLTLVTKAHTIALAADLKMEQTQATSMIATTGAITAKNIAIGILTGQMKLSAAADLVKVAATTKLKVAMTALSGPVGIAVVGIGLLVAGATALVKWFNRSTEEGKKLGKETEEIASSTEELSTAVEDSSKAYESNQKAIESNAETSTQLVKKIDELSSKEKKTAAEKKELKSYVDELNNSVDGLNLTYGEQSDALNMTSEQMLNKINLMKEEESLQASQERMTEIMREQNEVQLELDAIVEKRKEWDAALENNQVTNNEYKENLKLLEEQETSLSEAHTLLGEERVKVDAQIVESSKTVADASEQDMGRHILMFDELSESQQKTVESMKSTWQDYRDSATDMFGTLSEKSEISVSEMTKNLEENQRVVTKWSENIAKLAERGIDEGLLEELRQAGPESAGHVNALVKASDAELKRLSDAFAEGGEVATDALSTSLGIENTDVLSSVDHLITGTELSLKNAVKSADFPQIGEDIANGQAEGIRSGTPESEKAAADMAKKTEDSARKELQTHSPSKVFEQIGEDIPSGLVLGINKGTNKVTQAIKQVLVSSLREFSNVNQSFYSIGINAMDGLNNGLNARRSRVMSTARSIANSVANTMQSALRISSPSGVMRDDVGRWIPEGLADGIEKTAPSVYKAINKMTDGMMRISSPEMALGLSGMGSMSSTNFYNNYGGSNTNRTVNNNNGMSITIEKIENYSDSDIPTILEQSAWIMDRERGRLDE